MQPVDHLHPTGLATKDNMTAPPIGPATFFNRNIGEELHGHGWV